MKKLVFSLILFGVFITAFSNINSSQVYAQGCVKDSDCGDGDKICIDLTNDGIDNKTCESAAPGLQECGQYGFYSNAKEQCLGPDGSGVHITPRSNKTIKCKWEYVQSNCYSGFGVDSYGQCSGMPAKACRESNECSHDPDQTHTAGRCVEVGASTTTTPVPTQFTCRVITAKPNVTNVQPGQKIRLANSTTGSTGTWQSTWSITSSGSDTGSITKVNYNSADWTVPTSISENQTWTVKVSVKDGNKGQGAQDCTKEFKFPVTSTVTPTPSSDAFFQALGGNITALGAIVNSALPDGKDFLGSRTNNKDTGVISGDSLNLGSGEISDTNWKLVPYMSNEDFPTYSNMLSTIIRNAGFGKISDFDCNPGEKRTSFDGRFRFWCYSGTESLNTALESAINNSDTAAVVRVLIPTTQSSVTINKDWVFVNSVSTNATRPIILFADVGETGSLTVEKNLSVSLNNNQSGFMVFTNGDFNVKSNVGEVDGVYVFEKDMTDSSGNSSLFGDGSLLGLNSGLTNAFNRNVETTEPSEKWTYDPRYLNLFKNILDRPNFTWEELPAM